MKLFKKILIPENLIDSLHKREMSIEFCINKFRAAFLIIIAILDTVSSFLLKGINYSSKYEIIAIIVASLGISTIIAIYFLTKKAKKYYGFVKYISVTLDLFITFIFGFAVLFWMDFPIPISKETFAVLLTIIFLFFNILSVLRTDKKIVIYSGILTFILNLVIFLGFYFILNKNINMIIIYTSVFIIIISIFNIWVSEQILKSFLANKELENANQEILDKNSQIEQKNEELNQQAEELQLLNENLNQQNEEITAQRDEIEKQKEIVEEIHKEVEESIDYATRLQGAILPEAKILSEYFSEHFVLFKPKDKVSGDFYWWAHVENHTIITAADSTGHGVPGAFMSMLGSSFLREIVQKEYITNTSLILKKLRKEIIKALKQKGEVGEQKDGMDMAIISIDHETNVIQFSGANNPLYIVKSGKLKVESETIKLYELDELSTFKLYEVKPNKMPIAIYEKMDNFTTHEIQLEKGDQLYMFSDGFADQFGGPKGKKFKYKPFKKLLLENADKPMFEQKEILNKAFENWRGDLEQIDDVVVVGIKI